jgi:hypothetical protein
MDPATLALILGPQLISGALQYGESSAAREYQREQEARLQEALNRIGIPEARPEYFTPEVFQWLQNYDPEVAAYVRERDPRMVEMQSAEAKRARGAEQQVLQDLLDRSRSGTDVMAEIQRARGMREAAGTMASQAATLQQQLQRQGQQGGLAAYGAALQQQQGAGMQAALAGEQAALAGLQERGRAQSEAGTLAGRQMSRELDIERGNVNAINAFNQRLAASMQDQANLAAEIRNRAQQFNIGGRQRIAEQNVRSKADARDRQMQFDQQQYQNELAKYGRSAGLAGQAMDRRADEARDYNRMIQGLGDVFSTGGYVSAGYVPKGYVKQGAASATQQYRRPDVYDLGPAGDEPEKDPYAKYRLPRREI